MTKVKLTINISPAMFEVYEKLTPIQQDLCCDDILAYTHKTIRAYAKTKRRVDTPKQDLLPTTTFSIKYHSRPVLAPLYDICLERGVSISAALAPFIADFLKYPADHPYRDYGTRRPATTFPKYSNECVINLPRYVADDLKNQRDELKLYLIQRLCP
jgi:hypothetical protein